MCNESKAWAASQVLARALPRVSSIMKDSRTNKTDTRPKLTAIDGGRLAIDGSTALDPRNHSPEHLQRALSAIDVAIEEATTAARPAVALALASRLVALASHMLRDSAKIPPATMGVVAEGSANLISADEAARIAGVTRRWIYDHTKGLKFRRELSRKNIRLEAGGFLRWLDFHRP